MTTKNVKKAKKAVLSDIKPRSSQTPEKAKFARLREIERQIQAHADNIVYLKSRAMGRKGSRRIVGKEPLCALQSRLADAQRLRQTLANLGDQMYCLAKEREVLLYGC